MKEVPKVKCYECRHRRWCSGSNGSGWGCEANPKNRHSNINAPDNMLLDRCEDHNANGDCPDYEPTQFATGCLVVFIIIIIAIIALNVIF